MNKAKINELYEKAYVTYEVPYESSVVDPTIVSVHKQKVWDRYLFAELIVRECCLVLEQTQTALDRHKWPTPSECGIYIKEHFGVEK